MLEVKTRIESNFPRVKRRARDGHVRSLGHAAATVRQAARRLIRVRKRPSRPGQPPSTRGRRKLKNAILYAVNRQLRKAIVGPSYSRIGLAGAEHERGGRWREETFQARPFMRPALEKTKPRLVRHWAGALVP